MEGYIYIVDDSYAIYATDLTIKGITKPVNFDLNVKGNNATATVVAETLPLAPITLATMRSD